MVVVRHQEAFMSAQHTEQELRLEYERIRPRYLNLVEEIQFGLRKKLSER